MPVDEEFAMDCETNKKQMEYKTYSYVYGDTYFYPVRIIFN